MSLAKSQVPFFKSLVSTNHELNLACQPVSAICSTQMYHLAELYQKFYLISNWHCTRGNNNLQKMQAFGKQ